MNPKSCQMKERYHLDNTFFTLEFELQKSWQLYNQIRIASKINLPVLLTISKEMPSKNDQRRWLAENVKFLRLKHDRFYMNDQGAPIVNETISQFLTSAFPHEIYMAIEGSTPKYDLTEHRNYLIHLFKN